MFMWMAITMQVGKSGSFNDNEGNPAIGSPLWETNVYYTTNIYSAAGVSNPPPNGYVRWMMNGIYNSGATTFGGFRRNNSVSGGLPCQMSDIGFWNRALSPVEIAFVMTNGLTIPFTNCNCPTALIASTRISAKLA